MNIIIYEPLTLTLKTILNHIYSPYCNEIHGSLQKASFPAISTGMIQNSKIQVYPVG